LRKQQKKVISIAIKAAVIALVIWVVYIKLTNNSNLQEFNALLRKLDTQRLVNLLVLLLLMMLANWLLECAKWSYLCKPIQRISFWKAIEAVFCGLSWAIFTPNRIGEYGGRVLFLSPRKRIHGVLAMAVGAFAQMVITNVIGSLAFAWFAVHYWKVEGFLGLGCWLLAASFSVVLIILYFRVALFYEWIRKIKWLASFHRFFKVLSKYRIAVLNRVFLLSIGRFIIFTMQYGIAMKTLIPQLPVLPMFLMVFILFFIQSALPSLDLVDVGVRSITASYLFGFLTTQEIAVMASAAAIWFVNLILPAIIGLFFVLKLNIFGHTHH